MKRRRFLASGTGLLAAFIAGGSLTAKNRKPLTLAVVGDCIITRRASNQRDPGFLDVARFVRHADCAIGNCEMVFGDAAELSPAPKGFDMNLICDPFGADELAWMGFDVMGCANNHAMDYGVEGLRSTLQHLNRVGICATGAGNTLARAAAPAYFDSPGGRVALVNGTLYFQEWMIAQSARHDTNGRPGVNPLRMQRPAPQPKGSELQPKTVPTPNPADIERILQSVKIARRNAQVVCVMTHAHGGHKPGDHLQTLAHACIDAGADCFFSSGSHVLGGIELYRNQPICYDLGNFFFQYETVRQIPPDVYEAYGLDGNTQDPTLSYDVMSERYFNKDPACWESVLIQLTFEGSRPTEFTLHPFTLGHQEVRYARGLPRLATAEEGTAILERLRNLSEPYGTRIEIRQGRGTVKR